MLMLFLAGATGKGSPVRRLDAGINAGLAWLLREGEELGGWRRGHGLREATMHTDGAGLADDLCVLADAEHGEDGSGGGLALLLGVYGRRVGAGAAAGRVGARREVAEGVEDGGGGGGDGGKGGGGGVEV